jgi:hypothetical protein
LRAFPIRFFARVGGAVLAAFVADPVLAANSIPIPDFSGIWGRNFLFFEPPISGAGPIVTLRRNADGTMETARAQAGDYANPILKPQAATAVKKHGENSLRGIVDPDPHTQCWPEPIPFALSVQFGMEMLQQKDNLTVVYLSDHQVRHVRMNAAHPARLTPTWQGDSVGHYEGDTLVIDTVGQKVGPLSMMDLFGTPFSGSLHVVERYRLIGGAAARDAQIRHEGTYFPPGVSSPLTNEYGRGGIDPDTAKEGLQVEITVDDPDALTKPWSALVTYRHVLGEWPEAVCAENTRDFGSNGKPPIAGKPDF